MFGQLNKNDTIILLCLTIIRHADMTSFTSVVAVGISMQRPFKLTLSGRTKRSPLPQATENATRNTKLVTHCPLQECTEIHERYSLDSCQEEAPLMRSSPPCKQCCAEGGDPEMHEGEQRTRKYVKLIQDIELRLRNQDAYFAGDESNIFNVDVRLHQRSALSQSLFLILMDVY